MNSPGDSVSKRVADAGAELSRRLPLVTPQDDDRHPGFILDGRAPSSRKVKEGRLYKTFFLPMAADEGMAALRRLGMERFALQFVTIPANGGCVVAVYERPTQKAALLMKVWQVRQHHHAANLLRSIGATAVPSHA